MKQVFPFQLNYTFSTVDAGVTHNSLNGYLTFENPLRDGSNFIVSDIADGKYGRFDRAPRTWLGKFEANSARKLSFFDCFYQRTSADGIAVLYQVDPVQQAVADGTTENVLPGRYQGKLFTGLTHKLMHCPNRYLKTFSEHTGEDFSRAYPISIVVGFAEQTLDDLRGLKEKRRKLSRAPFESEDEMALVRY